MTTIKRKQNIKKNTDNNEYKYGLHRLTSFCDGVFAFGVTLMAITISIPDIPKNSIHQLLSKEIINLTPNLSYMH